MVPVRALRSSSRVRNAVAPTGSPHTAADERAALPWVASRITLTDRAANRMVPQPFFSSEHHDSYKAVRCHSRSDFLLCAALRAGFGKINWLRVGIFYLYYSKNILPQNPDVAAQSTALDSFSTMKSMFEGRRDNHVFFTLLSTLLLVNVQTAEGEISRT
jgi:hypothetical protein